MNSMNCVNMHGDKQRVYLRLPVPPAVLSRPPLVPVPILEDSGETTTGPRLRLMRLTQGACTSALVASTAPGRMTPTWSGQFELFSFRLPREPRRTLPGFRTSLLPGRRMSLRTMARRGSDPFGLSSPAPNLLHMHFSSHESDFSNAPIYGKISQGVLTQGQYWEHLPCQ